MGKEIVQQPIEIPAKFADRIFSNAIRYKLPVVFYRNPGQAGEYQFIAGKKTIQIDLSCIEGSPEGFLISPFSNTTSHLFIPSDVLAVIKNETISVHKRSQNLEDLLFQDSESLYQELLENPDSYKNVTPFAKIVQKAIAQIKTTDLKKVVLSRQKLIDIENLSLSSLFQQLCSNYPNSFVSISYTPEKGLWVGASPETLVCLQHDIFKTVALAGTQKLEDGKSLKDAVWTQKEIEEQALVSRYIINCFKTIRLREYEEDGPKTVYAGNLMHLKTSFWVNNTVAPENLTSQMLKLLHPTSAVGGMPREIALDFINKNEGFDRELFAGFIGPVNTQNDISLYVNLRCARIFSNQALLFAGAGITSDSDPEKEFWETELKMETTIRLLKTSLNK